MVDTVNAPALIISRKVVSTTRMEITDVVGEPVVALIVAAGRGTRAGDGLPKQYRLVAGQSVLRRSIAPFLRHPMVSHTVVVIHPEDRALYEDAIADNANALPAPINGGETRQASVLRGLEGIEALLPRLVLVHDAARPFVDEELITRVINAAALHPAVVPGVPVVDTIKQIDDRERVVATLSRAQLRAVQTPQAFDFLTLLRAHHQQIANGALTDDAAVMEAAGHPVVIVEGDGRNIKLTTPEDFGSAERTLQHASGDNMRIGQGYDVHAFGPGDHVMVGGVRIPHSAGVVAHSDGDVALHAATDAVLGAIGEGDIGTHFPPSDMRWRGVSSDRFLSHAAQLVAARGGSIVNLDITIVCEAPRIGPYRDAMRHAIADAAGLSPDRIGIKATTSEQMGFTGRKEGLAALAVALVRLGT